MRETLDLRETYSVTELRKFCHWTKKDLFLDLHSVTIRKEYFHDMYVIVKKGLTVREITNLKEIYIFIILY